MTRKEGFWPCWLMKQTGSGPTKRSKSSTYAHNCAAMSPTTKSRRKPLQPFKRSQIARRNRNRQLRWNASSETWTQGIKNPHRIFPNRTAGTPSRRNRRQTSPRRTRNLDKPDPRANPGKSPAPMPSYWPSSENSGSKAITHIRSSPRPRRQRNKHPQPGPLFTYELLHKQCLSPSNKP